MHFSRFIARTVDFLHLVSFVIHSEIRLRINKDEILFHLISKSLPFISALPKLAINDSINKPFHTATFIVFCARTATCWFWSSSSLPGLATNLRSLVTLKRTFLSGRVATYDRTSTWEGVGPSRDLTGQTSSRKIPSWQRTAAGFPDPKRPCFVIGL